MNTDQAAEIIKATEPHDADDVADLREKLTAARACAAVLLDEIQALHESLEHAEAMRARAEQDSWIALENPREPDEERQGRRLLLAENKRIRAMAQRYLDGLPHDRNAPTAGLVHRLCQTLAELRGPWEERETKLLDIVASSLGGWPVMSSAEVVGDLADALGVTIQYSPDGDHARIDPTTLPRWYVNAYEQQGIDWG